MSYPFEITKKGQDNISLLSKEILAELMPAFNPEENRFVWDGKKFYWHDLEAGHLEIDFFKKMRYRMQHINKAQEPLLRALGWKSTEPKRIYDMTAGLGRDSLLLFFAGFSVSMFERNPVLQILLQHALTALSGSEIAEFPQSIQLVPKDSITYLQTLKAANERLDIDAIYMDPMYPERKKAALVKKELRIIRNLAGADMDSELLLTLAIESGASRVVVKRPKGAEFVADLKPHHCVESPNTRFDVYLSSSMNL